MDPFLFNEREMSLLIGIAPRIPLNPHPTAPDAPELLAAHAKVKEFRETIGKGWKVGLASAEATDDADATVYFTSRDISIVIAFAAEARNFPHLYNSLGLEAQAASLKAAAYQEIPGMNWALHRPAKATPEATTVSITIET